MFVPSRSSVISTITLLGVAAVGVLLVVTSWAQSSSAPLGTRSAETTALARQLRELGCASNDVRAPARSALVRVDGTIRHVSVERAWAIYRGQHPGQLVAVCRTPAGRR